MDDAIIECILSYTDSGADYKNFCLVSKQWNMVANELFPKGGEFVNHLETLLKIFPNEDWDKYSLPYNPNIDPKCARSYYSAHYSTIECETWEDMQANPNVYRDIHEVCRDPNITPEIVTQYPGVMCNGILVPWNYSTLSYNINFTWSAVKTMPGNWNYRGILENKHTTFSDFMEISGICANASTYFTFRYHKCFKTEKDIIAKYVKANIGNGWRFSVLLTYGVLDWDFFLENYKLFFGVGGFVEFMPNTPWDIVISNPHIPWNYDRLCSIMPFYIIEAFPGFFNNYYYISMNPGLTWDMVVNNPHKPWNFHNISRNYFGKCEKIKHFKDFY